MAPIILCKGKQAIGYPHYDNVPLKSACMMTTNLQLIPYKWKENKESTKDDCIHV